MAFLNKLTGFLTSSEEPNANRQPKKRARNKSIIEKVEFSKVETDEEILKGLEDTYYTEDFDAKRVTLQSIPNEVTIAKLEELMESREAQQQIISGRLADKVIGSYDAFMTGMMQIRQIEADLQTTAILCKRGRLTMQTASNELTSAPLHLISLISRRRRLLQVLAILDKIKQIRDKESQLSQSIDERNFPKAISLCLECQKSISFFQQFPSMRNFNVNLRESYDMVKKKLDDSLLDATRNFTPDKYGGVVDAYRLVGETHRIFPKLKQHFKDTIHSHALNIMYAHVVQTEENMLKAETLKKLDFEKLCNYLFEEHFVSCLRVILEYLCDLIFSHYNISQWHRQQEKENADSIGSHIKDIRIGLDSFKPAMWHEMQKQVYIMLSASSVATFKIDAFLEVLDSINKFIEIGEEFSSGKAHNLRGCIKKQSSTYFKNFHKKKAEHMHTMLLNEMWQPCPLSPSFSIFEFKDFRDFTADKSDDSQVNHTILSAGSKEKGVSLLASFTQSGQNPFSAALAEEEQTPNGKNDGNISDEENEELKQEFIDEDGTGEQEEVQQNSKQNISSGNGPILTFTSVNFIKNIGNYLHMMNILHPIRFEIFQEVTHLFEYYMYTIHFFFGKDAKREEEKEDSLFSTSMLDSLTSFGRRTQDTATNAPPDNPDWLDDITSERLKKTLKRIQDTIIAMPEEDKPADAQEANNTNKNTFKMPLLADSVNSKLANAPLFGLNQRAVAIESLTFLMDAMNKVKDYIKPILPKQHTKFFDRFYDETVESVVNVSEHIYRGMANRLIELTNIPQLIANMKWDIKELGAENSPYIDTIITDFTNFSKLLEKVRKKKIVSMETSTKMIEWNIEFAFEQIVSGICRVRKCNDQGRALMSLDSQTLQAALKSLLKTRRLPKATLVDNIIKAYYTPESEFGAWITIHKDEYTEKQLTGLVMCAGANFPRRVRQELLKIVEEMKATTT